MKRLSLFAALTVAATPAPAASPVPISPSDTLRPHAEIAAVIEQARRDAEAIAYHLAEHRAAHRADAPGWPCAQPMPQEVAVVEGLLAVEPDLSDSFAPSPHGVDCAECGEAAPDDISCSGCREPKPAS